MTRTGTLVGAALVAACGVAAAQEVSVHGQVRPRFEYRDPTFTRPAGDATSMRVRAALEAALDDRVSVFVQLQDVRLWGEETGTLSDFRADNLDLHQGWVRLRPRGALWLTATIGRQETGLGGERLVGVVDWTQQAQSFDGVRVDAARDWGTVSLLAYAIGEESAPAVARDAELYGVHATLHAGPLSGTHLSNELDLTVSRRYGEHLGATAGLSLVMQDDPLAEIGRLGEDMTWFYLMLDALF